MSRVPQQTGRDVSYLWLLLHDIPKDRTGGETDDQEKQIQGKRPNKGPEMNSRGLGVRVSGGGEPEWAQQLEGVGVGLDISRRWPLPMLSCSPRDAPHVADGSILRALRQGRSTWGQRGHSL